MINIYCTKRSDLRKYLCEFYKILNDMSYKMLNNTITNSITINFIQTMIPHHRAAIYMCENLLKYTDYEPLENIAKNIIQMQSRGIEQMREIAVTTYGFVNSKKDIKCYEKKYFYITKEMICRMKNSCICNDINLSFIYEMIPHHEGAIAMCENLLKYYIDPRLKEVAESIIYEQSQGVKEMQEIRNIICN